MFSLGLQGAGVRGAQREREERQGRRGKGKYTDSGWYGRLRQSKKEMKSEREKQKKVRRRWTVLSADNINRTGLNMISIVRTDLEGF